MNQRKTGLRNIRFLYGYQFLSRLWFDAALWLIYLQHQGISLFQIGILEAVLHVAALLSDIPVGIFADRFGWKKSILCSNLAGILYAVGMLYGTSFWWFMAAFIARGLQGTFASGATGSIAYESAGWAGMQEQYRIISGRLYAISLVGMAIATFLGGKIASNSWGILYLSFALANFLSFCLALFIQEPRAERNKLERYSAIQITKDAFAFASTHPSFAQWLLFSSVISGFTALFAFYGQSLFTHSGWTLLAIGFITSMENGVGSITSLLADRFSKQVGDIRTLAITGITCSIGLLLFAWASGIGMGAGYLISSIAVSLAGPIIEQRLNSMIPTSQRATLLSAESTSFSLFMILVFPLFGLLSERIGLVHAAYIGSVAGVIGIGIATSKVIGRLK